MFDKICLMAAGHLAFFGTIDQAIHFFGQQGYPLPENFNPADHFIHTVSTHDSLKGPRAKSKAKVNSKELGLQTNVNLKF
jgi:ABC-type multidrug transport system ATPase subunit